VARARTRGCLVQTAVKRAVLTRHVSRSHRLPLPNPQRNAKKLTQKELAQQCMIPPGIINDYEAGRAIPDNALIGKFERVLGVKLPRAPKKK
jgi:hypothetical protein